MMDQNERFHVRRVDFDRERYVLISSERKYHDACIAADAMRAEYGDHVVVTDARNGQRFVYDSRALKR